MPTKAPAKPSEESTNPLMVAVPLPPDLKRLHELANLHAIASRELALERAKVEREFLALINRHADYMLEMEEAAKRTYAGMEELVRQNPEWLGDKRSMKTPVGTIKLTLTSSLSVADKEVTVNRLLLRQRREPEFQADNYFQVETKLDLEALEKLDDRTLEKLGIVRVTGDSFSFKLTAVNIKEALAASIPPSLAAA